MLVNRRKFNRVTEYYRVQGLYYRDGTEPNRDPTENYRDGTEPNRDPTENYRDPPDSHRGVTESDRE